MMRKVSMWRHDVICNGHGVETRCYSCEAMVVGGINMVCGDGSVLSGRIIWPSDPVLAEIAGVLSGRIIWPSDPVLAEIAGVRTTSECMI